MTEETSSVKTFNKFTWEQVPGYFDFDDIYAEMVARAPESGARFVEIGVMFGRSTLFMAQAIAASGKKISFDAVDRFGWSKTDVVKFFDKVVADSFARSSETPTTLRQEIVGLELREVVDLFVHKAELEKYVNVITSTGQERAAAYADGSLDFVFIDAQHTYKDTKDQLNLYLPKLKPSGVLAGHDFTKRYPEVVEAVCEVLGTRAISRRCSFFCDLASSTNFPAANRGFCWADSK
jgi:hypothetical protein